MRVMCVVAGWISTRIAVLKKCSCRTTAWSVSKVPIVGASLLAPTRDYIAKCGNEKALLSPAGLFCLRRGSDSHVGQGLPDVAQGAGKGRVFEFEALDSQVDAIGEAGVLGFGFK